MAEKNGLPRQYRLSSTSTCYESLREKIEAALIGAPVAHLSMSLVRLIGGDVDVSLPCLDAVVLEPEGLNYSIDSNLSELSFSRVFSAIKKEAESPNKSWSRVLELKSESESVESIYPKKRALTPSQTQWVVYVPLSQVHIRINVNMEFSSGNQQAGNSFTFTKGDLWWRVTFSAKSIGLAISSSLLSSQIERMRGGHSHGLSLALRDFIRNSISLAKLAGGSESPAPLNFPSYFDFAATVKQHYDKKAKNQKSQEESVVGLVRQFNNLAKSVLIEKLLPKTGGQSNSQVVLDLACGHGQDLWKYAGKGVGLYVGVDISPEAIQEAKSRYEDTKKRLGYEAIFLVGNLNQPAVYKEAARVASAYLGKSSSNVFDFVSIQFSLHYIATSPENSEFFLSQVSSVLKEGGLLVGTVPCSERFASLLKSSEQKSETFQFGNSLFSVSLSREDLATNLLGCEVGEVADKLEDNDVRGLRKILDMRWGLKYTFWLAETIDNQPEFLIPFRAFEGVAGDMGLKPLLRANFVNLFKEYGSDAKVLVEWQKKNPGKTLNDEEQQVFSFYRAFALKKTQIP